MKTKLLTLAAAVALATPALAGQTYAIDGSHATVLFQVRHFMTQVAGKFQKFDGQIEINREEPERSTVRFTIDAASVDTNQERRDNHLRSADFFDVENHPKITFASTSVRPAGDETYEVTGDFTMRGVTKRITLPVRVLGELKDPWGNHRIGFAVETTINRKDYGVSWNQTLDQGGLVLGDDVKVSINLEAVQKKEEAD